MFCYKCGCELNMSNRCPNCGTDVTTYKKILYTSNYLYNEGLEKAKVKDLSGAILSLKQSLWFNKDNLQARNLLGLVYFEIGEVVAAFSEWVISQNINNERLHEKKNLADHYLRQFQEGSQLISDINASINRYNHALECCYADNLDVAILQLKKVLQLNSHYLRARQLLALLYIETKQWARADKELRKCQLLDVNNTTTLRYLQEVQTNLSSEQKTEENVRRRNRNPKKKGGSTIKYQADNETIIQPVGTRTPGVDGFRFPSALAAGAIGLIIGAAVIAFMVMPARVQSVRNQGTREAQNLTSQLDSKDAEISSLQAQLDTIAVSENDLTGEEAEAKRKAELLMNAAITYLNSQDRSAAADALAEIDPLTAAAELPEEYTGLYNALFPLVRGTLLDRLYTAGAAAYETAPPDYALVIENLDKAFIYEDINEPSQDFPKMLFYMGDSYFRSYMQADEETRAGNMKNYPAYAKAYLQKLIHDYPHSDYIESAQSDLNSIAADVVAAVIFDQVQNYSTEELNAIAENAKAEAEAKQKAEEEEAKKKAEEEEAKKKAEEEAARRQAEADAAAQQAAEQAAQEAAAQQAAAQAAPQPVDATAAQAQANYEAMGMSPEAAAAQVAQDRAAGLY